MDTVVRTFKASGIVLALLVAILSAQPAAAEPNNGSPTYRERIDAARKGCKDSGGTFSMTIEVSQGRAHTKCAEKDGSSTNCTITMSSSVCANTPPAEHSTGPGSRRPIGDIPAFDAEITQADGQWAAPGDALPAVEEDLTVAEDVDPGTPSPGFVEADPAPIQPIQPVEAVEAAELEDEDG